MFGEYDDMMTTEEAKEALKIGTNTLYKLLRSGKLKAFRLGRIWKIPKAAAEHRVHFWVQPATAKIMSRI